MQLETKKKTLEHLWTQVLTQSYVWIYSWNTILFINLLCLQPGLWAKVRTASIVSLSQFDKSIFCAMRECSETTAHVLQRNCWVNSVHFFYRLNYIFTVCVARWHGYVLNCHNDNTTMATTWQLGQWQWKWQTMRIKPNIREMKAGMEHTAESAAMMSFFLYFLSVFLILTDVF